MAGIAALAVAYVLSQFYRSFLAVLTPALISELGATKAELSIASGAWFITFAAMQFVIGVSLDRYGPRRTASVLLAFGGGGGALLLAFAMTPWMVVLAMALIGIGCAPILMASVFIFAKAHSPARLAVMTSWLIGVGAMGNIIGASPFAAAAEAFGWRQVIAGVALATFATAAMLWVIVRDPEREATEGAGFSGYLELLKLKSLWPIIPLIGLNYAAAVGIRGLWSGPFLAEVHGAEALLIGQVTLFMAVAMAAGSFIYGPLDNIFGTRKWVAVTGNSISIAALTWLAVSPAAAISSVTMAMVLIGVCGGSYGVLMAHGRAFLPAHLTGRGMTLLNFFSIGGAGLMQFATGGVVTAATVPAEPTAAYSVLFAFYAGTLATTVLIYLFSRDVRPEPAERSDARFAER